MRSSDPGLRMLAATAVLLLALAVEGSAQEAGDPPTGDTFCRPADMTSSHMVNELRTILSSPDSAETELRRDARITYQPTATVSYSSDEFLCEQAIKALNARARSAGRRRQVYVYELGGQYAVEDPEQRAGEYRMLRIFDLDWQLRGDVLLY